jgi:chromate transporter
MMMIVSIGDWAGGLVGAAVVLIAFFGPTALLALIVGRLWTKLEKWPWRKSIQQGLAPVSIGLLLAGTLTMAKGAVTGWTTGGIALGVLLTMLWRKVNPALLVVAGAIIGGIVFFPR